jgi:hypothetical protein
MSDAEINDLLSAATQLEKELAKTGPRNDEELWLWVKAELGLELTRTAVCEGHTSPFQFLADVYFERTNAALAMANRGGSKTFIVAVLHWANARFKPGIESCTFGAVDSQSDKAYSYVRNWVYDGEGNKRSEVIHSKMKETLFKSRSKIIVLGSTPEQVNGPHPNLAHADEIELMRDSTWKESRNMRSTLETPVATPSGWKTVGQLNVGDFVFGMDGKPKRVLKLHDVSERDVYRVELTDGRWSECCDEHLWLVCHQPSRSKGASFRVIQTQEMLEEGLKRGPNYLYGLPTIAPVEYPDRDLPLDPYVLGVLLGDGCLRERVATFRAKDQDIVKEVDRRLLDGVRVVSDDKRDGSFVHRISKPTKASSRNPVMAALDGLGLTGVGSHDKFVPEDYKISSAKDRLDLIRGLMDTDGSFTKDAYFATVSLQLAEDVSEIVYSLGGRGLLRKKATSATAIARGSCGYIYEVSVSLPSSNPFFCERKARKFVPRKRTLGPAIRSITPAGRKLTRCITVEDSMYLVNRYIPTHNTISGTTTDGRTIMPQDILTSTRKGPSGRMQKLIDEIDQAVRDGYEPPRKLYPWCIKETARERPDCQRAPDMQRRLRLKQLGKDPGCLCNCDKIRKGEWDDGSPRLLADVCDGGFFRSRGWMPPEEIQKQFTENDRETFEVQQLCLKAEMKWHYVPNFTEVKHCIRDFDADPANGPIYMALDWGGTNPHAVNWYQRLDVDLDVKSWIQSSQEEVQYTRLRQGTIVCFDEIYKAEIGNEALADLVKAKEAGWKGRYPNWKVENRFADPQGKAARLDFKAKGLRTSWFTTREFDEHVKTVRSLFDDDLFRVDGTRCVMWVQEVKDWRRDELTGNQIDEANHAMSAFRYAVQNMKALNRRAQGTAAPVSAKPPERSVKVIRTGPRRPVAFGRGPNPANEWRKQLGAPETRVNR